MNSILLRNGLAAGILLAFASCTEEFPVYEEPADVLSARLTMISPDTLVAHYDALLDQWFLNTVSVFKIHLTNRHDDILQGKALIGARIVVQSFGAIPRTCVVELTRGDLESPTLFQGNLALAPGAAAEFSRLWVPEATDGEMLFTDLPSTVVNGMTVYGPITCIAWAEAQIFEKVQPIRTPDMQFTIFFATN
jgi:hypothetical protein